MITTHDRSRLAFAIALTVVALPALWMSSRDQAATSGAPTAGAAGVDTPSAHGGVVVTVTTYVPESPVFLGDGSASATPQIVPAMQGTRVAEDHADVRATYRRYRNPAGCTAAVVGGGVKITITNLSNGQSVVCRNDLSVKLPDGIGIVVNTDLLAQIANIANAPIAVHLTW